jgi:hypothetical protein
MIQKIKRYLLVLSSVLMFALPAAAPVMVSADCNNIGNKIAQGASQASGTDINCSSTNVGESDIGKVAQGIVNIFSIIVGVVAVIMIIYGGFRYITSGGDSGSVGNAKNTLIYAIVGLIIVALAQLIVHFVLNQTSQVNQ